MTLNIALAREIDIPAEIDLELEVYYVAPFSGRWNCRNDDAQPPDPGECDLINQEEVETHIRQWFNCQREETVEQFRKWLRSDDFRDYVEEQNKEEEDE